MLIASRPNIKPPYSLKMIAMITIIYLKSRALRLSHLRKLNRATKV